MKEYHNFFGIDIAKNEFVVARYGQKKVLTYDNTPKGIKNFLTKHKAELMDSLVVLETTGGYEWQALQALSKKNIDVHRADTVKVKNYIRSMRHYGKTDAIDALGLATYGFERCAMLKLYKTPDKTQHELQTLVRRRDELVRVRVQESNRLNGPLGYLIASTVNPMLKTLDRCIKNVEKRIEEILKNHPLYRDKKTLMMLVPGVGETTANALLALMPELGYVDRKEIAHLAGVAPHPHDSGKQMGYRKTRGGRPDVKKILYMAAMAASRSSSWLGDYYRSLLERGKKGIVALVALMRKIIVILNARLRDMYGQPKEQQHPLAIA